MNLSNYIWQIPSRTMECHVVERYLKSLSFKSAFSNPNQRKFNLGLCYAELFRYTAWLLDIVEYSINVRVLYMRFSVHRQKINVKHRA